ncbi:MAG: prolipoprotein diacylglyceryl transferase [Treponema sp.]|nr:prolipoprotein diacylglyceryl transferase [Treponema sp.]
MLLSVYFPSWLKPEIIPGLPFRWYGLMYIFAFAAAFLLYRHQVKERRFPMTEDQLYSLFTWGILGLLLGARIFSTLVYETSDIYVRQPWLIFWPFRNGQFTGLTGMSYHGGAVGGLIAVILWAKFKKFNFREIGDMYAASIPLGYTFGRLGNFINAELYGRVTDSPLGMVFPNAGLVNGENLPRHPSQLYEMVFEGIILWTIIWFFRNRKPFKGFLLGLYFLGYGLFRFFIEYFREPDAGLGFPLLNFTTGQILCFLMIVFGITWIVICSRLPNREPVRIYDESGIQKVPGKTAAEKASERNQRRKIRKRLR